MQPFIRTYIPKTVKDIVGQDSAARAVQEFVKSFPKEKAVLLYGPSGVGKTALATAIANESGWELFELNASDARDKATLNSLLGSAISQRSFFSAGKIILLDEVDGLSGSNDRGGMAELARLIEATKFPMIITCRDPYADNLKAVRKLCQTVELSALGASSIATILTRICEGEKLDCPAEVVQAIARRVNGDARAAINDLQVLAAGKTQITKEDLDILILRSKIQPIEEALTVIFKSDNAADALRAFDEVEEDIDEQFLWLDYNMPIEYTDPSDMVRAYGCLVKADVYRKRIMRRQHWRFLVYVGALLTAGIATAKDAPYRKPPVYKQTTRLLRIWQVNMSQAKKKSIAQKIAAHTHTSTRRIVQDFGLYQQMFRNKEFAKSFAVQAKLDDEEVTWMIKS